MLLSLNWLKDFVKISSDVTPEELGLRLTHHTVEIENMERQGKNLDKVVVGEILNIKKHPNADRLNIAQVDVGEKKPRQIIFGKMVEMEVGSKIPVALAPTKLPGNKEINKVKLLGEISEGMLCLDQELGLFKEGVSIQYFDKKTKNGTPIKEIFDLNDVIFEVDNKSITHRPDLWSHYGMAREIAAFLGIKFIEYEPNEKLINKVEDKIKIKVKVEDEDLCPRYMAISVNGIKVEPSPKWMSDRLIAVGMRPINNIVDITNYVMLEFGQPMHAFDERRVNEIIVRRAKAGENIETLDGVKRNLDSNMLVIADAKRAIAIAGVMGGGESEINNDTTEIILESANFNFISIRKTSQKLGLRTESSMRFEKALDPNLCEMALIRAIELIKKLCLKAKVASKVVDEKKFKLNQGPIILNIAWLDERIGNEIKEDKVKGILKSLGFKAEGKENEMKIIVPTWRATRDISIKEDLMEEVTRIYGYNNLKPIMPKVEMKPPKLNEEKILERKIKNILSVGASLTEVYNYSFVGEDQLTKLGIDMKSAIKLANPIASHQTLLRTSLAPNLLENVKTNQAKEEEIRIYEIGSIYLNSPGDINKDNTKKGNLPYQEKHLGVVIAGEKGIDVFSIAKGVIAYLLNSLELELVFERIESPLSWAEKGVSADIIADGKKVGVVSKLDKRIARNIGIKKEVAAAEISLRELEKIYFTRPVKKFEEFAKYPPATRDLAFVVDEKILYNNIKAEIVKSSSLIKKVELFDVYQGEKLGHGKKNLAFHIIYQADKTLTSEEVDKMQKELVKKLEKKFGAKIRNF